MSEQTQAATPAATPAPRKTILQTLTGRVVGDKMNKIISKLADDKMVFYKDIGEKFLTEDGTLEKKIMPDFLHLSQEGYEIWANSIKEDVQKLLK